MTLKYPDICPQNLVEPWWEEDTSDSFKSGRLVWAFLPHVDQVPYKVEPVGRDEPKEHQTGIMSVKRFKIGAPARKKDLPVAAMPVFDKEMLCIYRTKKRPAIIISKGGAFVEKRLTKGKLENRTNRTVLLAPSYSVQGSFNEKFCERVRRCEYPQFMWDDLPIGGTEKGSIIRFDHLQPVGRSKNTVKFTKYCLSEKAMTFIVNWVDWLISGYMDENSEFCKTRSFLMEF
jgi:hypothetical protein